MHGGVAANARRSSCGARRVRIASRPEPYRRPLSRRLPVASFGRRDRRTSGWKVDAPVHQVLDHRVGYRAPLWRTNDDRGPDNSDRLHREPGTATDRSHRRRRRRIGLGVAAAGDASNMAFGLDWPHPLFAYQMEGIERLLSNRSVLLADEMGLGKTIQAVAGLRILSERREIERALIICPTGLIAQWRRQIRIWAPDLPVSTAVGARDQRMAAWRANAMLYLSNFESVRADLWARSEAAYRSWDVVVLDEAQRIKNAKSGAAAVVKSLERSRSWALTGTPLENRLEDLLSVLDFAAAGEFDPSTMGVGLRGLMSRVQLRRRRAEVLDDLPPKFASVIGLDLTPTQRAAYEKAEEEGTMWLRSLGRELRIAHVLELILRLKQICNFCPETGHSTKLADLQQRLDAFKA